MTIEQLKQALKTLQEESDILLQGKDEEINKKNKKIEELEKELEKYKTKKNSQIKFL